MEIRIGISGWRYAPWRTIFYPEGLKQKNELRYASRQVNSIEINGSFYSLQTPKSFQHWHDETPDDFLFSVKGPRYITHIKRLNDVEAPVGNFFGSGVLHLKNKLGPFLWQFPPSFSFREDLLESFLKMLPRTGAEALELSHKADRVEPSFPDDKAFLRRPLRHAIEIRNYSFENPRFIDLLKKYKVALVFADTAGKWPYIEEVTADFLYLRLHGEEELYSSGYGEASLKWWAQRIVKWSLGSAPKNSFTISEGPPPPGFKDIYVYFDNDIKVHAPFDAMALNKIVQAKLSREIEVKGLSSQIPGSALIF